ncbi:MAG: ribosome maturation factor RimM [Chloroflexota bacterium]|nr:ribosome maturation factor RimM [Chloroflexota bacterium]
MPVSTSKANQPGTPASDVTPAAVESPPAKRQATGRRRPRPKRSTARPPRLVQTPGPDPATPLDQVRLTVGTIIGPHGVQGEAKVRLTTDQPDHLQTLNEIFVGEESAPRRLLGLRFHQHHALLRFSGCTTPEAVEMLRGQALRIHGTDARPLEPGEFFLFQLLGLTVRDEAGNTLGQVIDVMETGAHDVLVISPPGDGPDLLLPNHPEVVLDVRPDQGWMIVRPLEYA